MYNYTALGDINTVINDIVSAFPADEATAVRKELYNDLNFDNMLAANEASVDASTGMGKLLEIMMHTVDGDMHTKFEYIDRSKGDITKVKDFYIINASINYINKIDADYHYSADVHNMSRYTVTNLSRMNDLYDILKTHKNDFVYGYRIDNNVIKNTYCALVCVLVDFICMNMIDVTRFMEKIAESENKELPYKIKYNACRNGTYLRNTDKMIKIFHDGSWNKLFSVIRSKNGKYAVEDAAAVGLVIALIAAIPIVAVTFVYIIRFFIAFYFESAVNIKRKCGALKEYIEEVSKNEDDPKALYKQTKAIKVLGNIVNFIETIILKEDRSGMDKVEVADRELRTSAYISDRDFNEISKSGIDTAEITFM